MCACDIERGEIRKGNGGQEVEDEGGKDEEDPGDAEDAGHDDGEKRSRTMHTLFIEWSSFPRVQSRVVYLPKSLLVSIDLRHEHTYSSQRRKLRTWRRSQQ